MKINKTQLKRIISEELRRMINEADPKGTRGAAKVEGLIINFLRNKERPVSDNDLSRGIQNDLDENEFSTLSMYIETLLEDGLIQRYPHGKHQGKLGLTKAGRKTPHAYASGTVPKHGQEKPPHMPHQSRYQDEWE